MGNVIKKFVYVVIVAASLSLATTVVNAGPFGPLTSQEVGNVCSRCESIITKNLPAAESIVYIKKSGVLNVKCGVLSAEVRCEFDGNFVPKLQCDMGDTPMKSIFFALWEGKEINLPYEVAESGWLNSSYFVGQQPVTLQQTTARSAVVCANTTP